MSVSDIKTSTKPTDNWEKLANESVSLCNFLYRRLDEIVHDIREGDKDVAMVELGMVYAMCSVRREKFIDRLASLNVGNHPDQSEEVGE